MNFGNCSNDSYSTTRSDSRTPTPRKDRRRCEGEKCLVFLLGKEEEPVELRVNKENVMSWKHADIIIKLIPTTPNSPIAKAGGRGKQTDIKLPEFEATTFKIFLHFLQTDELNLGSDFQEWGDLIKLCTAYGVSKLFLLISAKAIQSLSLDNCVTLYKLGAINELEELRVAAYNFFLKMGNAFVEHKNFLEMDCITLSILISSDEFHVVEVTLFKRLREWVTRQCQRLGYPPERDELYRRAAGRLFCHVRYVQMTPKEFRTEVIPSGMLTQKDIDGINLRYRTHPNLWHTLPPHGFVDTPRLKFLQLVVPLYQNVQMGFRKIGGACTTIQESVRLMVSHDIYLTSIGFFGPAKSDRCANGAPLITYSIRIHVEGDYSKYHCRCPSQNATVVTRDNFSVDLSTPFQIQRMQPYKLTVWIDGEATQFGVIPLPQAMIVLPDKGLITFHFSDADNDPPCSLSTSGYPTSTPSPYVTPNFPSSTRPFNKQPEGRISGVIRSVSFVIRD